VIFGGGILETDFPVSSISEKSRLQIHIITFSGWPGSEILWHYRDFRKPHRYYHIWAPRQRKPPVEKVRENHRGIESPGTK
jgi:hypothetical protein